MSRTPEETKKGLEHCINGTSCRGCPYCEECAIASDCNPMHKDLQDYIQQLESGLSNLAEAFATLREQAEMLEAERDALLEQAKKEAVCFLCKHPYEGPNPPDCDECRPGKKSRWEWQGIQKEEST